MLMMRASSQLSLATNYAAVQRRRAVCGATGQRGVALIEALISILVFSFGILGLIGLEAQAINFSVNAEDRTRAAMFASDIASYLWINNTVSPPSAQKAIWNTNIKLLNNAQGGLNNGSVSVNTIGAVTSANSADIVITWTQQSDPTAAPVTQTLTTRVTIPTLPAS